MHSTNGERKDTGSSGEVCFDLHTENENQHHNDDNHNKHNEKSDSVAGEESGLGEKSHDGVFSSHDVTTTPVLSTTSKSTSNDDEAANNKKKSSTPVLENGGGGGGRGISETIGELSIHDDSLLSGIHHHNSSSPSHISCYLCIKVNKNRDFITCPMNRKMKNRLSSEFWFQINDNR